MKKIAFISTNESVPWGGSEELWSQTAMRMVGQGYMVDANVKGWGISESDRIAKMERANCKVFRRRYPTNLPGKILHKIFNKNKIHEFLSKSRPDLVIISQGTNFEGSLWMEECILKNIPFAAIIQASSEAFGWADNNAIEKLIYTHALAKKVFFVSQTNLDIVTKQIGINLPNAKVIANPFNVSYDTKIQWVENSDVLKLACVARLDVGAKGQDILLEVLKAKKWRNRAIEISFFGNGMNEKLLEKLVILWDIKQVEFHGHVKDISNIWKEHHAIILPSRVEGLPIALVEAMLCARSCIVTDVASGNAPFIKDNITGFIAKAPRVEFIDEALERAWNARDTLQEMGQAAALCIRKEIPADPIETFISEIKCIV